MSTKSSEFLTATEKEIFCRYAAGETQKQIAFAMNCCVNTIDYHTRKAKRRFGANSIPALIAKVLPSGLLQ